jgi:hypothetical protein
MIFARLALPMPLTATSIGVAVSMEPVARFRIHKIGTGELAPEFIGHFVAHLDEHHVWVVPVDHRYANHIAHRVERRSNGATLRAFSRDQVMGH